MFRASLNEFNLARPPRLGEERFERAVEAQDHEPTLARHGLDSLCWFAAGSPSRFSSAVDGDVKAPKALDGLIDQVAHVVVMAHVRADELGFHTPMTA